MAKNTVVLKAFTGMPLGEFAIESKTSKTIVVMGTKGEMIFDAKTGLQTNSAKPRYANRIDLEASGLVGEAKPEEAPKAKPAGSKPAAGAPKTGSKKPASKPADDEIPEA